MPDVDNTTHGLQVRIAVLETKLEAADEARVLQAKEYERRLQDLNHAHQQATDRNTTYVSRELYDSGIREVRVLNEVTETRLSGRIDELSSKVYVGIGILLTIQVLVFVVIEVWKR